MHRMSRHEVRSCDCAWLRFVIKVREDIVENGIHLAGGGSLLRGLARRLSEKVNIPFYVAEDPLRAVARGTCLALKNTDNYSFLMR